MHMFRKSWRRGSSIEEELSGHLVEGGVARVGSGSRKGGGLKGDEREKERSKR